MEAQLKFLRLLPRQDVSAFYWTLLDFAGRTHTDDPVPNELITFIEGLANSVVRWEVRKAEPTVVDDEVSLLLERQSQLKFYGQQPDTSAALPNGLADSSTSQSEIFSQLIFSIKEEVKRALDD